jgi:APA family basic amino acid/polyamine antiporter
MPKGKPVAPLNRLFMRKTVEQMHAEHETTELKKSLGPFNLIFLGIGCIIGTGIFVLTGRAAAEFAGPGIMISFVITGVLCALVALSYAELASAIPVSGSAYSYSYASMGEVVAWAMGLLLVLEYGLAASTVAVGWSGYVTSFLHDLGVNLPHALTQAPGVFVATDAIQASVTNPTVDISGATAVLADGARVTIGDGTRAVLSGTHPIAFKAYDIVAAANFDLNSTTTATLQSAAQAYDSAARASREIAAGTQLTFLDGSGSRATLAAETVRQLAAGSITASTFNLPALIAIIAVTTLLVVGVSESALVNNVVVVIKVSVVIAFIVIGMGYVKPELWSPLVPAQVPPPPPGSDMSLWGQISSALWNVVTAQNTGHYGIGGLIAGAATIFFAYIGFEAVSTAGAESKNPSRDMPIGILGSLAVCTILYILTSAVLVGIVPYTQLNDAAPIAKAVNQIGLPWFASLVKIGAIAGLSSVMLVLLYGQTRIFYTMARDGLIPQIFANVHKSFKTPWINTIVVGLVACYFAGFMGLDQLANLTNVGTLAAFAIVCATVLYLRYARPNINRPFKTPLFPITPILGALMCLFLLMSLMAHKETREFFLVYLGVGMVLYFAYGMWFSKLGRGVVVTGHEPEPDLGARHMMKE